MECTQGMKRARSEMPRPSEAAWALRLHHLLRRQLSYFTCLSPRFLIRKLGVVKPNREDNVIIKGQTRDEGLW